MREFADRRFLGLLEAAPDAMVCVELDGRIAQVNAQAERLFGYGRDDLVGQAVEILVPDGLRGKHSAHRARYAANPRDRPLRSGLELAGRCKDGTTFPAEISLSTIDTGEGTLIMAAVRDVTERRVAAETAARLASIIQSSNDAVIGKTLDQVITSWNPAAERLYGYTAQEMIGKHTDILFPPECREREASILAAASRGERVEDYQTRRVRKDGTTIPVSLTLSPITDSAGKMTGISTVARDITERQRGEARFRGLLEAAPDAMVCVAGDGRIALVNAQAGRLFGYSRDELVGQSVEMLVPDAARAVHAAQRARYAVDPRPRPMGSGMELAGRRKDGSTFPAEISLSAMDTDEGILVTAAVRDISERLEAQAERERLKTQAERARLERQLQQSQRLESLGQLAGGVAHDFNNLLGVISSYADFVAEQVEAVPLEGWDTVRSDIAQVRRAAERAAELTHQLLTFARGEMVQPRVLDLNEMVASVEQLLRRTLGEHVELIAVLASDLNLVLADPGQIEQVLVNLAVNARDAMPGGGTLTIETANTYVDEAYVAGRADLSPGRYVTIKVSDTGTGMPAEVADRVFEPFFSTKPPGEGTGLGLATVYGIITQAGGTVRLYSEPGLGSSFVVFLPVTDQSPASSEHRPAVPERGRGERVLIVEDEPALREVTRRILGRNGYEVLVAGNGREAIDIAAGCPEHLDVLLTDVVMPGMQGSEVADRVRAVQPGVRVLYMSGYTQGLLGTQQILAPGVNLVEKPFTEVSLLAKLRAIIGG
jgi:two-component system cell cycle sensor histidine kinase/response regulator CckA